MRSKNRPSHLVRVALLIVSAVALFATGASAGGPGKWTRLSPAGSYAAYAKPGMVHTADGVLHILWVRPNATTPSNNDLVHTSVAPDGTVGSTTAVVTNINFIWSVVDLILDNGQLRAFWPETAGGLKTATSADGTTWSTPVQVVPQAGGVGATMGPNNTTYQTMDPGGFGVVVHAGLSSGTPVSQSYSAQLGHDGYAPNIAADLVNGTVWVTWFAYGDEPTDTSKCRCGVYAQQVDLATGNPIGSPVRMPGSATVVNGVESALETGGRVPITGRPGGDIYVTYVNGFKSDKVLLWRIGATGPAATSRVLVDTDVENQGVAAEVGLTAIAATPDGRIWVAWESGDRIFARMSNDSVTDFAPAQSVVQGGDDFKIAYTMEAEATNSRLDVVTNMNVGTTSSTAFWHSQFLAPPEWTSGPDTLSGTAAANLIYGGGGNDRLRGRGGNDKIYGGSGADRLGGDAGFDRLNGGPGRDICHVDSAREKRAAKSCETKTFKRFR